MAASLAFLFIRHRDWQPPETWITRKADASAALAAAGLDDVSPPPAPDEVNAAAAEG